MIVDVFWGFNYVFEILKFWDDVMEVMEGFLFKFGVDWSGFIVIKYIVEGYDGGCIWFDRNVWDVRVFFFIEVDLNLWFVENLIVNS